MMNVNSNQVLTQEQIKQKAPSIYQTKGAPKTSDKYVHIPTSQVIEDMKQLGWDVVDCKEVKARKEGKIGFQKHLLIFRNPDIAIESSDGDNVIPQILLSNSHDGSSCFEFRAGIFRLICENGLVVATKEFNKMKIRHMGYTFDEVKATLNAMLEQLPLTIESMNTMRNITLNQENKERFAGMILGARFGENAIEAMDIDLTKLLQPTRNEDKSNDLFTVFNVLQEKMVDGGFEYKSTKGKFRKARPIKNFQLDIEVNQKMFEVASQFAEELV